jgi:dephospho-CoA kinase
MSFKVGITGGIGAGKSTISRVFEAFGAPIYNADERAKWLQVHDSVLKQQIISLFGNEAYTADGSLNRTYLASQVFADKAQLQRLNALVHPAVGRDFIEWLHTHAAAPYVIKEAALMIESGSYQQLDFVINVSASDEERIRRVVLRDPQRTRQQVEAIIANQLPEKERQKYAQLTIVNDDSSLLVPKLWDLHQKWTKKGGAI